MTRTPPDLRSRARTFEPRSDQVCVARRFVGGVLAEWGLDPVDTALLVSELATNAVLHARSDFRVTVTARGCVVRIEVFDRNPRLPSLAAVSTDAYSGRGLMIVQDLALSWGVESHPADGKTIWFEVPLVARSGGRVVATTG